MTKVINLYGGPGTGKSTTAAGIFYLLKCEGVNCEMAREYAKEVVWEGRRHLLAQQIYVFAKQLKLLNDLDGKVDYIISDSPLILSSIYGITFPHDFHSLVLHEFKRFENINYYLKRDKTYEPAGRVQDEDEAYEIDFQIREYLEEHSIEHEEIVSNDRAPLRILAKLEGMKPMEEI